MGLGGSHVSSPKGCVAGLKCRVDFSVQPGVLVGIHPDHPLDSVIDVVYDVTVDYIGVITDIVFRGLPVHTPVCMVEP